jgi:hypothetical protein
MNATVTTLNIDRIMGLPLGSAVSGLMLYLKTIGLQGQGLDAGKSRLV